MTTPLRPAIMQGLIPTNVPGAFLSPPPPPGFTPQTASTTSRIAHGFHWRQPGPSDSPALHKVWDAHLGAGWSAGTWLMPQMVTTGKVHRPRRRPGASATANETTNWGGGVLAGNWTTAVGTWTIPTVSKPTEAAGSDGGWDSSTWVGLDGSGSNDVLQAGIEQSVDARGNASYVAWYEWFCAVRKQTLGDTSPTSPSLATLNGRMYIAWIGDGNDQLNVMVSTDAGQTFHGKLVSHETSPKAPVLCVHAGHLLIAWIGNGNAQLNVASVTLDGGGVPTGLTGKVVLGDTSPQGPALASLNGNLYLAWNGRGNEQLNVMVSSDGGRTFGSKLVAGDTSPAGPSLVAHDGKLLIGWTGERNHQINVAQVALRGAVPTGLTAKAVLQDTTPFTPALASSGGKLFLAWRGDGNDQLNVMYSTNDGAAFANKYISPETSTDAPALVDLGGTLYIGWKGDGNKNLNVAPVGVVGGLVTGFTTPAYLFQVNIPNFKVSPGDSVTCSVQYIGNKTAGQIAFKNVTTGVNFPITLVPPPGAAMSGNSAEWVIEVPTINNQYAHLPAFTPVAFTSSIACGLDASGRGLAGNPQNATETKIFDDKNRALTSTKLGDLAVTISYVAPPTG
jgi:Peptidase A4 family